VRGVDACVVWVGRGVEMTSHHSNSNTRSSSSSQP
jgi:hypothetical protein